MAAIKKSSLAQPPFSAPGFAREFQHPNGSTYSIQVTDCRVYQSWSNEKGGGGSNCSTRDGDAEAQASAYAKMRGLLGKGFVEVAPRQSIVFDTSADIIETRRTQGRPPVGGSPYQAVPSRKDVYLETCISNHEWLVASPGRTVAIALRCVSKPPLPEEQTRMADAFLDLLEKMRDDIFLDRTTPIRKLPTPIAACPFTHLIVTSPAVENSLFLRPNGTGNSILGRSIFRAFPGYDCEFIANDPVVVVEARTRGRGSIPCNHWPREPHPVFDLAYLKTSAATPEFCVYDPAELEQRLSGTALAKLSVAEVQVRNYQGAVRRFVRGEVPNLDELRQFFGMPPR